MLAHTMSSGYVLVSFKTLVRCSAVIVYCKGGVRVSLGIGNEPRTTCLFSAVTPSIVRLTIARDACPAPPTNSTCQPCLSSRLQPYTPRPFLPFSHRRHRSISSSCLSFPAPFSSQVPVVALQSWPSNPSGSLKPLVGRRRQCSPPRRPSKPMFHIASSTHRRFKRFIGASLDG